MNSIEVYDPEQKCHYRILVSESEKSEQIEVSDDEDDTILEAPAAQSWSNITVWTQKETLALLNMFSLHKDQFKSFKKKRVQWNMISAELAKIGINKAPEKCEIKWKNLLRVYRQRKYDNKGPGKFEFFNEIDNIIANDPHFSPIIANSSNECIKNGRIQTRRSSVINSGNAIVNLKGKTCSCIKSEKQKRHEDRMALMTKKMEIEERKVKAFEDYLKFLKRNSENM